MTAPAIRRVLVIGATGHLGGKAVDALLARGHQVRALVRASSDTTPLKTKPVELVRGDLLDPGSLDRALAGTDALVTTANGFFRRQKGESPASVDLQGHLALAEAAKRAGIKRFVLTSVLNCDKAVDVPHFYAKKVVEDRLTQLGVPFVALRPGSFIDQREDRWAGALKKGSFQAIGDPARAITHVPTVEVARCLALAVDHPEAEGKVIDIGCDRPLSARDIADLFGRILNRPVKVQAAPWAVVGTIMGGVGLFKPMVKDLRAMLKFLTFGPYVADTSRQRALFGDVPRAEDALTTYAKAKGLV
ncbi:MAG: hypothetical protein RLY86_517 [Pseudomonadota bacterium]|jgi:uncharacterized protein YbjT (DUF2867 family)